MNFTKVIFCLLLCSLSTAQASPEWMKIRNDAIVRPDSMSADEQAECTESILTEMNRHFKTSWTADDIAPVQMPGWDHPEAGFIRGGGYNIRIVKTLNRGDESIKHIKAARYSTFESDVEIGAQPSLHIPGKIDGQQMFNKETSSDKSTTTYDFIAHSDSAYAFLPIGSLLHLFEDVIGAKTRRPCPVEHGVEHDVYNENLLNLRKYQASETETAPLVSNTPMMMDNAPPALPAP
jgi:hypothetical protein